MTQLPGAWVGTGEEGHDLFPLGLGGEVLPVLGHVTHEKGRVVEHHEVLFRGRAEGIAHAIKLRVGIAVGQAHPGLPGFARLAQYAVLPLRRKIAAHAHLGFHATVGFGMGIAQYAGVAAVLFYDTNGVFDDGLGMGAFISRDLLLTGHRAGELPAVVGVAQCCASQAQHQQQEQHTAQQAAQPEPDLLKHRQHPCCSCNRAVGASWRRASRGYCGQLGPAFQGLLSTGVSCFSSALSPMTLRYSISAQRSSGCNARPMTPSWRQPSRNSWPRLLLPVMPVSSKKPPGNLSLTKPACRGSYSKLPTQNCVSRSTTGDSS